MLKRGPSQGVPYTPSEGDLTRQETNRGFSTDRFSLGISAHVAPKTREPEVDSSKPRARQGADAVSEHAVEYMVPTV